MATDHSALLNGYSDYMTTAIVLWALILCLIEWFKHCLRRHHSSAIAAATNLDPANNTISTSVVIDVSRLHQLQQLPLIIDAEENSSTEGPVSACLAPEGDDQEDDCAICLNKLLPGEEMTVLDCKHKYHKLCIDQWLLKYYSSNCPICREKI